MAAIVVALTALRGNEVGVHAQGGAWAARALFYLEGAGGDMVLFPLAVLLAAVAVVLLRTGVLPGWLGWVGPGSRFCSASWVSLCRPGWTLRRWIRRLLCWRWLGWPGWRSSLAGRWPRRLVEQARPWTEPRRGWPVAIGAPDDQPRLALTTPWKTDPVMTAGALAGVSYKVRAFGVHWIVA